LYLRAISLTISLTCTHHLHHHAKRQGRQRRAGSEANARSLSELQVHLPSVPISPRAMLTKVIDVRRHDALVVVHHANIVFALVRLVNMQVILQHQ
jgi:hypothetical protein